MNRYRAGLLLPILAATLTAVHGDDVGAEFELVAPALSSEKNLYRAQPRMGERGGRDGGARPRGRELRRAGPKPTTEVPADTEEHGAGRPGVPVREVPFLDLETEYALVAVRDYGLALGCVILGSWAATGICRS